MRKLTVLIAILMAVAMSLTFFGFSVPSSAGHAVSPEAVQSANSSAPVTVMAINHEYVSHNTTAESYGTVTFPSGPFSKIVVYYENFYVSNPWDYSYQVKVNGVQIAAGNTNESQNTTVQQDVTEYYSVIVGHTVNVTAYTAEWEPNYSAYQSVWFVLYPGAKPNVPNVVIPVPITKSFAPSKNAFPHNVLIPYNTSQVFNVTFPANVTSGHINFYALQNGNDEGWYANQPPFREFKVSINGTTVAEMWPYPNVQTGGWDLFLWQPITAIGALLDHPYTFNLDPYVSLLHGTKSVNITVVNNEDLWIRVALNFMLYTTNSTVNSTFTSRWTEMNVYNQTPATNMTTESIPTSAEWLNDSQLVKEDLNASSTTSYGSVVAKGNYNITNYFSAYSSEFDPSENIVVPYGTGYLLEYNQTFGYVDMINITTTGIITDGNVVTHTSSSEHLIYAVSMVFTEDLVLSHNGSLVAIIIKDSAQQSRYEFDQLSRITNGKVYVRTIMDDAALAGYGAFDGQIVNGVITKMYYNHASTFKTEIHSDSVYDNGSMHSTGYERMLYAVNNSVISRDGIMILDRYIML